MQKIKKGDKVQVLSGKDKGREGVVEWVLAKAKKVIVPEANMVKRHVKGSQGQKGGIYDLPKPMSFGKVALVCPNCKKPTRVGFTKVADKYVRKCQKCGREIDLKKAKK